MENGKWKMNIQLGDCLELITEIPDASVDAIICDAPYFMGMTHNGQKGKFSDLVALAPFYKQLFRQFDRVCKPRRCIYFFTDWWGYAFYYPIFDSVLGAKNGLVWDKRSGAGAYYTSHHEWILFHCDKSQIMKGSNVIREIPGFSIGAKKVDGEKVHPTQKPTALIEKLITDSTQPGDTVLDPMMGSGTTGVACVNTGRNFIGFELDENYFEIATRRIIEAREINP